MEELAGGGATFDGVMGTETDVELAGGADVGAEVITFDVELAGIDDEGTGAAGGADEHAARRIKLAVRMPCTTSFFLIYPPSH